jgi:hypothetical protein
VIDFRVSFAVSTGAYAVWSDGLVQTNDIITGLTPGQTYKFKVEARNIIGFSEYSSELTVLAA